MELGVARKTILEIGRELAKDGLVAATNGNISMRLDETTVLITATGKNKGRMQAGDLLLARFGALPPPGASMETGLHLLIYQARPEVRAVIHAHPPKATAWAAANLIPGGEADILPEIALNLGKIGLAAYAEPGSEALALAVREALAQGNAALLANHGAVSVGDDLWQAYDRLVLLEHYAQTMLWAHLLGGAKPLMRN
ncbi:MAG: class II aldolase/adducin family protein [Clostridiales bacterium]|nr:class II aldolase/adducin family protein [Clostridiales bacterium]